MLKKFEVSFIGCVMCLCMAACGGLEDKSIIEPLSLEQRQELMAKDFNYALVFSLIDMVEKDQSHLTSAEKKSYSKLTYRRMKDFLSKWSIGSNLDDKREQYKQEWMKIFDSYTEKVDSISDYWKNFMEAYEPDTYVKVELVEITDMTDVFFGYVTVNLRLVPLKGGNISDVQACFGLDGSMMGRNGLTYKEPFSSPIVGSAGMKFNYAFDIDASKVKNLPLEELLKEYPFKSRIESLKVNGKDIDFNEGYYKVPSCIRTLWQKAPAKGKEWQSDSDKKFCYETVITELIDSTMVSQVDYVHENIRKDAYEDDNLAALYYYVTAQQY